MSRGGMIDDNNAGTAVRSCDDMVQVDVPS